MSLLLSVLLSSALVLLVCRIIPGVRVDGWGSAIGVAVVYGLLTATLGKILLVLTLPVTILTFGLFALVLNGFMLWITDKLLSGFEIRGTAPLAFATLAMTFGESLIHNFIS